MSNEEVLMRYDRWITDDSEFAALVVRQWLVPVEGKDSVVFPPTYAKPERLREEDWLGYNIDRFDDGTSVCQIDSVGSQANRLEPIFKREPYQRLVPQITIEADGRQVNLLDAGHRAADAIVRFSNLASELRAAYQAWLDTGNAQPLAKIAPTSIVFGSWDSRDTQAKLPRIMRSVIRAYDVKTLHRSAQYSTIAGEILEGANVEVTTTGPKAELGLAHVPAAWTHGGVQVLREIRRDGALNLAALRALGAGNDEEVLKLRRYILGLALVVFTAPQETFLREGCQLVLDKKHPGEWQSVKHDGETDKLEITPKDALAFAQLAATNFVVGKSQPARFNADLAREALGQTKEQRKAARRRTRPAVKTPNAEEGQ
ncbi:MAG: type I-G CRISPR-associated RAMP protein Csb1/Cas7g [Pyrinomonadaceae bacterium]